MSVTAIRSRPTLPEIDHPTLWTVAIVLFELGDLWTTHLLVEIPDLQEANPVARVLIAESGIPGLAAGKIVALATIFALYQYWPRAYRAGLPIGLALVGGIAVANNLAVIAVVIGA